jgi:hypothetical protein
MLAKRVLTNNLAWRYYRYTSATPRVLIISRVPTLTPLSYSIPYTKGRFSAGTATQTQRQCSESVTFW